MKKLHDDTEVSVETPTKFKDGLRYLLTKEEKKQFQIDKNQFLKEQEEYEKIKYKDLRRQAYDEAGITLEDLSVLTYKYATRNLLSEQEQKEIEEEVLKTESLRTEIRVKYPKVK